MNGITYANIETVATMTKGNTDIIITGDSSRNKTQVMPGGVSVTKKVKLSNTWDSLVTSVNYFPISDFYLTEQSHAITPPANTPAVLTNGTYRNLDPASGDTYLTRAGRVYFDSSTGTLNYYAYGASAKSSVVLDPDTDAAFIAYLSNIGYNSSFTVANRKLTDVTIRFSSNSSKLSNNTVALTNASFSGLGLTLHANNTPNSNAAGGIAKDGATVVLSDTVTSYTVNLDGSLVMGDTTDADFVRLNGTTVTVDPDAKTGAAAVIGASNNDGTYRTLTFVNSGDGTYTVTYNTANTLSYATASVYLKGTFNNWGSNDVFSKTDNADIVVLTKELAAGSYEFKLYNAGADKWYSRSGTITETANRITLNAMSETTNCALNVTGGTYEFKFELSTRKLSVFPADNNAMSEQPTAPVVTEYILGDADGNGFVNIKDVTVIQRHIAGIKALESVFLSAANVNCDEQVNISDATVLQRFLAKYTVAYPIGETAGNTDTPTQPATQEPTAAPTTVAPTTAAPTTAAPSAYTVVFSNALNWSGTIYCYYWADGYNPVSWPGTQMQYLGTNDYGQKQYTMNIPPRATNIIFTNGSVQTVDLPISGNTNFYTKNETENGKYKCGTW